MKRCALFSAMVCGLTVSGAVHSANPAVIPSFLTPEINSPTPKTAQLDGCAVEPGGSIQISWSASTTAQISLTPSVDVAAGIVQEDIKMLLSLAGSTLLDVKSPNLPGGTCASCAKTTGPIARAAGVNFSAPGVQSNFAGVQVVNSGPIFNALAGGGSATVSFDPQGQSSVINWGPNVQGGVNTQSTATVSCVANPPPPPPPPPPVPAIGMIGAWVLGLGLASLGALVGFRRRP